MKRQNRLMAALFLLMVCGCSTKPLPPAINPPASAMQPCPVIPILPEPATMGDLLDFSVATVQQYNECSSRHDALMDSIKVGK